MGRPEPKHLIWCDLETVGQPDPHNLILEFAALVTDSNLGEPLFEFSEVVRWPMVDLIRDMVAKNPVVLEMHTKSGLLNDLPEAQLSLDEIDAEFTAALAGIGDPDQHRRFRIAGSGVAHFDHPLIKVQMPKLAAQLHYAPMDTGQFRRGLQLFGAPEWIPYMPESWSVAGEADGRGKAHRALADARAHLEEARAYKTIIRDIKVAMRLS